MDNGRNARNVTNNDTLPYKSPSCTNYYFVDHRSPYSGCPVLHVLRYKYTI